MRKNIFVKVSGDVVTNAQFRAWVTQLATTAHVVVCVGGGTAITKALTNAGYVSQDKPPVFGPLGRELATFAERKLARDVLEDQQQELQDALAAEGTHVLVEMPVLSIGTVLCHINGDTMVETVYLGFDELYVVTTPERQENKQAQFAHLPKVSVVSF